MKSNGKIMFLNHFIYSFILNLDLPNIEILCFQPNEMNFSIQKLGFLAEQNEICRRIFIKNETCMRMFTLLLAILKPWNDHYEYLTSF